MSNIAKFAALAIERVERDNSLREMAAIVETTDDAIILKNLDGVIEKWNAGAQHIYGYTASEAIGQNVSMLVPEDRRFELDSNTERIRQGKNVDHFETVRVTKAGRRIDISLTICPVRDSQGVLSHFIDVQNDISERVLAQREVARERAVLDTIVNGVPDALMLVDLDRNLTHCNRGAYRMFGYEPGELNGQSTVMLYANSDDHQRQKEQRFNPTALEHTEIVEIQWRRKNGVVFTGETVGTIIRDQSGKPLGYLVLVRDITKSKQADETIREGQRKLSTLMKNLPGAAFRCLIDSAWTMEFISDGCMELTGYSSAEFVSNSLDWLSIIHDEDSESVQREMQQAIGQRRPFLQLIYRIRHRSGDLRWVWVHGEGVYTDDGRAIALEGLVADMSELQAARINLVQSERLAAVGQMVSGIGHESRNALQRIQVGLDMLEFEIDADSELRGDLDRISRAKDDLLRLFEELRNYTAPIRLDSSVEDLSVVWRQAWTNLECSRVQRDAQLVEEIGGMELMCCIDVFRIEQVFRNLFENALAACADPVRITVSCSATDIGGAPAVCVSVRDNGPGLSDELKTRIFEAFYTTKTKGTGLGMAIAERIVQAHRGSLSVGDAKDGGAEFLISLPRTSK